MEEFYIEYFIENNYESLVRKANFQLLVIPLSNADQVVSDLKFYCSESQEGHLSKNSFGFDAISYYISTPFTEFWFKLSAKIQKKEINPFYVSPLLPTDEYQLIHSLDFQIDNHLFIAETELTKMPAMVDCIFPDYSDEMQLFDYLLKLNS